MYNVVSSLGNNSYVYHNIGELKYLYVTVSGTDHVTMIESAVGCVSLFAMLSSCCTE